MSNAIPNIETHVPVTSELPPEGQELAVGRPDIPPPSLWQQSVKVVHKLTGQVAVVVRVDWNTNMFRAYYPDEIDPNTGKPGRFSDRTEWQHCKSWDVAVTYSPRELERQAARKLLVEKTARLDAKSLAAVSVLCDDADPAKSLAKLEALVALGVVKAEAEVAQHAIDEMRADEKKNGRK